jgi:hypothetical protein
VFDYDNNQVAFGAKTASDAASTSASANISFNMVAASSDAVRTSKVGKEWSFAIALGLAMFFMLSL